MQMLLASRMAGDHSRVARMAHFMGLIRTGVDGMASLGVVLRVEGEGFERGRPLPPNTPDPMESLETAIGFMQRASTHATHEEGPENQEGHGQDLRVGEG